MEKIKKIFNKLQIDSKSVLFTQEKLNEKLLKKVNKSKYEKDKQFVNIFNSIDKKNVFDKKVNDYSIPIKAEYVRKSNDIDRSTLFSFQGAFELLHADLGNLEFLGKSATDPRYCLVLLIFVHLRKLIALKLEKFYEDVNEKRKNKKMRLQTNLEFKQKKIFDLNKKYNIEMYSTAVRGGKAFATEQKIR